MVAMVLGWVPNAQPLLVQLLNDPDPDVLVTAPVHWPVSHSLA